MSTEQVFYSIQKTYIIKPVSKSEKRILTCDERIDIPTIEPLPSVKPVSYEIPITIIPCIELAGEFLSEFNLTFETNEGVTVLPIEVFAGSESQPENPYMNLRYVLVLPRDATGVKSCKLTHKATGKEVQHSLTFGVMPPPYNYDNALFGYSLNRVNGLLGYYDALTETVRMLKLVNKTPTFESKDLPKGAGKQTIRIASGVLFYNTSFSYPLSPEPTIHKPKITLHGSGRDQVYTLSLNKTINTVSIDLFTGMITVYAGATGEIIQQFKLALPYQGFETLSFEDFDDIDDSVLRVSAKGARVE